MEIGSIGELAWFLFDSCAESLLDRYLWKLYGVSLIFKPHNVRFDSRVIALVADIGARLFRSHRHVRVKVRNVPSLSLLRVFFHCRVKWRPKSLLVKPSRLEMGELLNGAWDQLLVERDWGVHNRRVSCLYWFTRWHDRRVGIYRTLVAIIYSFRFILRFQLGSRVQWLASGIRIRCWSPCAILDLSWCDLTHCGTVNLIEVFRSGHLCLEFGFPAPLLVLALTAL